MTLLLSLVLGTAHAADRSRMRSFYQHACQTNLAVPRGLKIVTGAVLHKTSTETEFDLAVRRLGARVVSEAVGNHDFAAYLYALATESGQWHQAEDFFFAYLERAGNERLAARLLPEALEILKSNLLYPGVGHLSIEHRIRFVINVSRVDRDRGAATWTEFVDEMLMGEEPQLGLAAAGLVPLKTSPPLGPASLTLFAELERAPVRSVAELDWDHLPIFIGMLRLDRWVRAVAALPGPDRLTKIREHLFELSHKCTRH